MSWYKQTLGAEAEKKITPKSSLTPRLGVAAPYDPSTQPAIRPVPVHRG